MDSQKHNPNRLVDEVDDEEVLFRSRDERHATKQGGTRKTVVPNAMAHSQRSSSKNTQVFRVGLNSQPLWVIRHFLPMFNPASQDTSSNTKDQQNQKENVETQFHRNQDGDPSQTQFSQHQIIELEYEELETPGITERETELESKLQEIQQAMSQREQVLQAHVDNMELQHSALQAKYGAFILEQQEASFKQMESARWLPMDESTVMSCLDKLKKTMRAWAKTASIKDISMLQSLKTEEYRALVETLSNVVVLENEELPRSILAVKKSPMLLLNALLAHHVHITFSRSPFFFLGGSPEKSSSTKNPLKEIFQQAQSANPREAHIWRSQTLRLLMPPLGVESSDGEKELNQTTDAAIARVAQQEASAFLDGPASFLVGQNPSSDVAEKLEKIYQEAATQAYMLWTRRTELRCYTLQDVGAVHFDPKSEDFDPDNLVKYEDHEDQLKGRPVAVMVHPLLCVAGSDEGNDYDRERVWAKGVVWLDSKVK